MIKSLGDSGYSPGVYCADACADIHLMDLSNQFRGLFVPSLSAHGKYEFLDSISRHDLLPQSIDVCMITFYKHSPVTFYLGDAALVYREGILQRVFTHDLQRDDAFVSFAKAAGGCGARDEEGDDVIYVEGDTRLYLAYPEFWEIQRHQQVVLSVLSGTFGTVVNQEGFFVPCC